MYLTSLLRPLRGLEVGWVRQSDQDKHGWEVLKGSHRLRELAFSIVNRLELLDSYLSTCCGSLVRLVLYAED